MPRSSAKTPSKTAEAEPPPRGGGPRALLVAAERLIAEHGVAGVSMRQIVSAAGQANNYAVQHHFGDKMGLVRAILEMRISELNQVREALLRSFQERDDVDLRTLVAAVYLPIAEVVDDDGMHVYAIFKARVDAELGSDPWGLVQTHAPAGHEITARMQRKLPHLDAAAFRRRMRLATILFHGAMASGDPGQAFGPAASATEAYLSEVITACTAIFQAPEPDAVSRLSRRVGAI